MSDHLYRLVLETLIPLPEDRKCFRMINGVLVERTVKDVVPALQTNADGLRKVLDDLVKQYKSKQDELEKWKVCEVISRVPGSLNLTVICRRRIMFRSCSHEISQPRTAARPGPLSTFCKTHQGAAPCHQQRYEGRVGLQIKDELLPAMTSRCQIAREKNILLLGWCRWRQSISA